MVLRLKTWESRSPPNLSDTPNALLRSQSNTRRHAEADTGKPSPSRSTKLQLCKSVAGWSSPVARQAHNLKVTGSNPVPATTVSEDLCIAQVFSIPASENASNPSGSLGHKIQWFGEDNPYGSKSQTRTRGTRFSAPGDMVCQQILQRLWPAIKIPLSLKTVLLKENFDVLFRLHAFAKQFDPKSTA